VGGSEIDARLRLRGAHVLELGRRNGKLHGKPPCVSNVSLEEVARS
jgi:hypothetical protein